MFCTSIQLAERYNFLEEKFKTGYEFLRRADLNHLEAGSFPLENGVVASVQIYTTVPSDMARFEAHEKHFDIQFIISGEEMFEVADKALLQLDIAYDAEKDTAFYKEPAHKSVIYLKAGDLIVVAPEDAHKPRCAVSGSSEVKKVLVKIPV